MLFRFKKFPDFGKEVMRDFEVHRFCYDCRKFVRGCKGRSAHKKFVCTRRRRYHNVITR